MFSKYLSDPEIRRLAGDDALIGHMLRVEITLAKVQSRLGVIPDASAREITEKLTSLQLDPEMLSTGTLKNGIPTIPLLAAAKKELSPAARDHLHWGATSQDIMDTATILMIREIAGVFRKRLSKISNNLEQLAQKHEQTPMVARTRTQQAVPITFGLKVRQWYQPLQLHLERLDQLEPRLYRVQFGGAGGDLAALGEGGTEVARALAEALDLAYTGTWHTQRDTLTEWASWQAMVSGSLGKMAGDLLLMSQTEIGEIKERRSGGSSSTMPHKNNPVLSEAIVALARYAGQLACNHFQAMLHQQERDGAAWVLEWLAMPPLMLATGTALRHAMTISEEMEVDPEAMLANLEKLKGLIFSERASFLLTEFMSRQEAKQKVESACELVQREGIHLAEALGRIVPDIEVDWEKHLK